MSQMIQGELRQTLVHKYQKSKLRTMHTLQMEHRTAFLSKIGRFKYKEQQQSPGPGSYQQLLKQKHTSDFHVQRQSNNNPNIPQQYQWIIDNGRELFPTHKNTKSQIGPGKYDARSTFMNKQLSNWAKDNRFNYQKIQSKLSPGPGSYYNQSSKNAIKSVSKIQSNSSKKYINAVIRQYKKIIAQQLNPEVQLDYISDEHLVNQTIKLKKKAQLSPVFRSKTLRLAEKEQCQVGPGTYTITSEKMKTKMKNKVIASAIHKFKTPSSKSVEQIFNNIEKKHPSSKQCQKQTKTHPMNKKIPLGLILKQSRFNNKIKDVNIKYKQNYPGPQQYMQNRHPNTNVQLLMLKSKRGLTEKSQKQYDFGTADRSTLANHNEIPFGSYETKYFDLSHKMQKQKQRLQTLRQLKVTLPAFNSKNDN